MLRKKILAVTITMLAFASSAIASPKNVEQTVMIIAAESTVSNDMPNGLSKNSISINAYDEISSTFITELVVAAHYMATRELPSKVYFVTGARVVNIHSNSNAMPIDAADSTNHFEVGWQAHTYNV